MAAAGATRVAHRTIRSYVGAHPEWEIEIRTAEAERDMAQSAVVESALFQAATDDRNVTAQIFFLKNRAPERWRDLQYRRGEYTLDTVDAREMRSRVARMSDDELQLIVDGETPAEIPKHD